MGYDPEELKRNPALQIEAGARYLKQMLDAHGGNVADALAAYNWGPGNMQKLMRGEKTQIPAETANYVTDPRFAQWTQPAAQPGMKVNWLSLSSKHPNHGRRPHLSLHLLKTSSRLGVGWRKAPLTSPTSPGRW
jgi:hypothetical protein